MALSTHQVNNLQSELSAMRSRLSAITDQLAKEYGAESRVALRAEEVQNSLQRLQWQIEEPNLVARAQAEDDGA